MILSQLSAWLQLNELNVSTPSTWVTLGGNVSAHREAVEGALALSSNAVYAPALPSM